jgi:hypothetical protein
MAGEEADPAGGPGNPAAAGSGKKGKGGRRIMSPIMIEENKLVALN